MLILRDPKVSELVGVAERASHGDRVTRLEGSFLFLPKRHTGEGDEIGQDPGVDEIAAISAPVPPHEMYERRESGLPVHAAPRPHPAVELLEDGPCHEPA